MVSTELEKEVILVQFLGIFSGKNQPHKNTKINNQVYLQAAKKV